MKSITVGVSVPGETKKYMEKGRGGGRGWGLLIDAVEQILEVV